MKKTAHKSELEKKLEAELAGTKPDTEVHVPVPETDSPLPPSDSENDAPQNPADVQTPAALMRALETRTSELEEAKNRILWLRADFDNYRKRTLREAEQTRKTAAEGLIRELFPVMDNLDRALAHASGTAGPLEQGVAMVLQQLRDVLAARGVERIIAAGKPFDPAVHEALSQIPSDQPEGVVIQEYECGYRIGDYVLRPAKVIVSGGSAQTQSSETNTKENIQAATSGDAPAAE